jgi:hypothetical protein
MSVAFEYCALSDSGLCDRPIPHPEDSYSVCVCVCPLHQQRMGRRGPNEREIGPRQNSMCLYVLFFSQSQSKTEWEKSVSIETKLRVY